MRAALLICLALLLPSLAQAETVRVSSKEAGIDFETVKVAHLYGPVTPDSAQQFIVEVAETIDVPGDRVVLINSSGGDVLSGNRMIAALELEKTFGVRIVCIAEHQVSSMAFNLFTRCDTRLALPDAFGIVHKIARIKFDCDHLVRCTSRNLRAIAAELDRQDEPFRQVNAKALHLSLPAYDAVADAETLMRVPDWIAARYLDGLAVVQK